MPVHKLLLGDKLEAGKWLAFATQQLRLLGGKFNQRVLKPNNDVLISLSRFNKQEYIKISVGGLFGYEFISADFSLDPGTTYEKNEFAQHYKVGAKSKYSAAALEDHALMTNAVDAANPSRLASPNSKNVWEGADGTFIIGGVGTKYTSNIDTIYTLASVPSLFSRLSTHQTYTPNNQPIEVSKPSTGERTIMAGVDGCAAAISNGVLISIDNYGNVKAALASDTAGVNVKSYTTNVPKNSGLATSYWVFNKTGDAAVAVVYDATQTAVPIPPPDYEYSVKFSLAKMSFTAAVNDAGDDFTLAINAETVLYEEDPDVFEVNEDFQSTLAMWGADFHYIEATDTQPEREVIVTTISDVRAVVATPEEQVGVHHEAVVVNAEDISEEFFRFTLRDVQDGHEPTHTIQAADLRTLSFIVVGQIEDSTTTPDTITTNGRAYIKGVEKYAVGDTLTAYPGGSGNHQWWLYNVSESVFAYADVSESESFVTVRDDNWAAYTQVGSGTDYATIIGFELDKIVVGDKTTTHKDLYEKAVAVYTQVVGDPVLIEPAPVDFNTLDNTFRFAVNGAFYTRK